MRQTITLAAPALVGHCRHDQRPFRMALSIEYRPGPSDQDLELGAIRTVLDDALAEPTTLEEAARRVADFVADTVSGPWRVRARHEPRDGMELDIDLAEGWS